jgi:hypothetical protein
MPTETVMPREGSQQGASHRGEPDLKGHAQIKKIRKMFLESVNRINTH